MQKSVGAVLHMLIHLCSPQMHLEAQAVVKQVLSTAMHAMHCASHGSLLNLSPGAVAFQRDMFLDIPLISDVLTLQEACQEQVDQCVLWANTLQFSHDWNVNDQALKREVLSLSNQMKPEWTGPYIVYHVHANGTCTIWLTPNVMEWLNICQLKPNPNLTKLSSYMEVLMRSSQIDQAFFLHGSFNAVLTCPHCGAE